MNQKKSLDLSSCFLDLNDPIELFKMWIEEAKKTEPNDPNAFSLATADKNGVPSARIVLLKDFNKHGFTFYTNLDSPKSNNLKKNPKAEMCFHWKSLQRQIRIFGKIKQIEDKEADIYFNSRPYESKIGAWASDQSEVLYKREDFLKKIEVLKKKYKDKNNVPRPKHWSGWSLAPFSFEFWLGEKHRIHERLKYNKVSNNWEREILYP